MANNYTPNFSDPRVVSTTKRALTFVEQYTKDDHKRWISSRHLYKYFGNTSRPLGKYLKENLLIVADPYYNVETGVCKKYLRNTQGVKLIKQLSGLEDFEAEIAPELVQQLDSGDFDYEEKSNRLYNPLQFVRKQVRGPLLANHGYAYNYDIEAAAPTLLIQRAQKLNPKLDLARLEHYTQNRSLVREQISRECEISQEQVKAVINAVLQGGVVSRWQTSKVFQILNYSYNSVINLQNNQVFQGISKDISSMWSVLKQDFPVRYLIDRNGKKRTKRLSSKDKSGLYRELEDQVGKSIRKLLKRNKIKCLWIHDGWCCDKFIDPNDVELEVRRTTGYSIKLEWNKYKDIELTLNN